MRPRPLMPSSPGSDPMTGNPGAGNRGRPATRDSYHHGDLRGTLLEQAPRLIAEIGREKFSLRTLAAQSGVSHAAVYRHFGSLRELYVAVALEGFGSLARIGATLDERQPLAAQLEALALAYFRWAMDHPGYYQVMFGPRLNEDGTHPEMEAAIEAGFAVMDRPFLAHGADPARARELTLGLTVLLHGYCDLVGERRIRVRDRAAAEAYLRKAASPFIAGACAELSG